MPEFKVYSFLYSWHLAEGLAYSGCLINIGEMNYNYWMKPMESPYLLILCWLPWIQMMKAEVRTTATESLERSTCKARPLLEGHRVMPSLSRKRRDFWSSQPLKTLTALCASKKNGGCSHWLKKPEDNRTDGALCAEGSTSTSDSVMENPTGTSRGHFGWLSWPSLCPAAESCEGSMRLHWHRFPFFFSPYILRERTGYRLTSCSQLPRNMAKSQTKKEGILQRPGEGR